VAAGQIDLFEGDAVAAERCLRAAYDGLRTHGLRIDAAQAGAYLGRALLALGRYAEAEALSHESEALAGDDLRAAVAWRGVRAEALARRGEHAAAVEFARAAVAIAGATDALLDHAEARRALAAALRSAGRAAEADAEDARTVELWEAKGATLLVERARRPVPRAAPTATGAAPPASVRRRVRPNAATINAARIDAAIAARDVDAYAALLADGRFIHHPTGATYDREGSIADIRTALQMVDDLVIAHEPLAALADSLALCRRSQAMSGARDGDLSTGAAVHANAVVIEVDAEERRICTEVFADDRLGDAIARLYERHGELLPDGPARTRAAATARSVATVLALSRDPERYAAALAPDVEFTDHQPVGLPSGRGAAVFLRGLRALYQLADDITLRVDDVLALRSDALLARMTNFGTLRDGGGAYERHFIALWVFGADGLLTRFEWFAADREDDSLGRFDELTTQRHPVPMRTPRPRVRANAATANAERFEATVVARDGDGIVAMFEHLEEIVQHPTGVTWDRTRAAANLRAILAALTSYRFEALATLGDALVLGRLSVSATGLVHRDLDLGPLEMVRLQIVEVDANGNRRREEFFADDRLGAAIARMYERHAELLPTGSARDRATATARAIATLTGRAGDPSSTYEPDVECVDYRTTGFGSGRGVERLLVWIKTAYELADDIAERFDEILVAQPTAIVLRCMTSGKERVGGGAFEWPHLRLVVFGAGGLVARVEVFDAGHEAEALARFDELAAAPRSPRITNAATRLFDRFQAAWDARDWGRVVACLTVPLSDRRRIVGVELDGDQHLETLRSHFETYAVRFTCEPLATRGERLALCRVRIEMAGGDVGPSEIEPHLSIFEVDALGNGVAVVTFDLDDVAAAHEELDRRYDAGEGATRRHTTVTRAFLRAFAARDWDTLAGTLAPDLVVHDHRLLGWETLHGPGRYIEALRSLVDLAPDVRLRLDHIETSARGALYVPVWEGTHEGGAFESPSVFVAELDEHDRIRRFDQYDFAQLEEARSRFDAVRARFEALQPSPLNTGVAPPRSGRARRSAR
jgi:tetratricopeptide (TPR) repeat protein